MKLRLMDILSTDIDIHSLAQNPDIFQKGK